MEYIYGCSNCKQEFLSRFRMGRAPKTVHCPECGQASDRVIRGTAGIIFKGSGFYCTDYGTGPGRTR